MFPRSLAGQQAMLTSSGVEQQMRTLVALLRLQSRCVTTTSSSKRQQVAHQRRLKEKEPDYEELEAGAKPAAEGLGSRKAHQMRLNHLDLWHSIDSIKRHGHRLAQLDPLQLRQPEQLKDLTWSHALVERLRSSSDIVATRGFLDTKQPLMAVNELLDSVWSIYANSGCGLEFAHISSEPEVEWLTSEWERLNETFHLDYLDKHNLAKLMLECEAFDQFMAAKYPTVKRYGCEGAESMLVVLDEVLRLCHLGAGQQDELTRALGRIDDVIIGMPHRGRLNLLACLLGFEPEAIFSKTRGEPELDLSKAWMATGDVLSHLSANCRFVYGLDRHHIGLSRDSPDPINVSLLPNPSHLEVAAPLTMGVARGRAHNIQHGYSSSPKFPPADRRTAHDYHRHLSRVLPVQIHGDASLAGQGIIQETLQMSKLAHFSCGGSLHLVVNNQIGYTTEPSAARSARHCTDIFKMIEAPVIHVNGQNVSGVVRATRLALAYRQQFGKDVAINLVCYRRHGHNEMDEPSFTQPLMYERIRKRKSIPQTFCDEIKMQPSERGEIQDSFKSRLQAANQRADRYKPDNDNYRNFELASEWHRNHLVDWQTGVGLEQLRDIALDSVRVPADFRVHPNLRRVLVGERVKRFSAGSSAELARVKVDWASAEILAFGSLLAQNHSVRLAGQDVARGTFSTRHAVLYDQTNQRPLVPLNEMVARANNDQLRARLEVANTILSEEAALALEFGYSIETCQLSIWEAQFGDFFNTAQSIIDTLVSSAESKWLKQSALTLLLPHGLDGAGPEHSSAHLERFLQMSSSSMDSIDTEAKCNWSVCFPTMPSQYFHLLRRQVLRPFRKPLVVMSPKSIFRHAECQSELADFAPETGFRSILDDPLIRTPEQRAQVDTVVLCSGKFYFTLDELRRANQMENVALIRIEELCPFPVQSIMQTLAQYPNVDGHDGLVWCQEEHKNQGAYNFVAARLKNMAKMRLDYLGRPESELPATGSSSLHKRELEQLKKQFVALKG